MPARLETDRNTNNIDTPYNPTYFIKVTHETLPTRRHVCTSINLRSGSNNGHADTQRDAHPSPSERRYVRQYPIRINR